MSRQTLYLQMWHGYWRVRKPVPKLLIPIIGKGQYLTRSLRTANFNEAKRLLPDHMHCLWTLPEGDADFPGRSAPVCRLRLSLMQAC
jgi:hypothetical protein